MSFRRSIMEGVCLGTKAAVKALCLAGLATPSELRLSGGATKSPLWLQMHADATGLPVAVTACDNAPLLGAALLAGVGAGVFGSSDCRGDDKFEGILHRVRTGISSMVRVARRIAPNPSAMVAYDRLLPVYTKASRAVSSVSHALASMAIDSAHSNPKKESNFADATTSHMEK